MSRRLATALVVGLSVLASAAPADAHTVTGVQPTNYRSEITAIAPPTPGLTVQLLDLGNRVRLTYHGAGDLVVLGYDGEAYLRIGPGGVFENRLSPAVALNRPTATGPTSTGPAPVQPAAPEWRRISGGSTVTWRDRRTRWESKQRPTVALRPGHAQVVAQWTIAMRRTGGDIAVSGRITWVPPPSATPWLLGTLLVAVLIVPLGLLGRWGPPLSAVTAVVIASDIVHSIGNAMVAGGSLSSILFRVLIGGLVGTAAWVAGLWAIAALQRERTRGLLLAGFAVLAMVLMGVVGYLFGLGRSELPYAFAPVTARVTAVVVVGGSVGLLGAIVLVFKRHPHYWLADVGDERAQRGDGPS